MKESPIGTETPVFIETPVRQTIREHEDLRRRMAEIRTQVDAVLAIAGGEVAASDAGRRTATDRLIASIEEFRRRLAAHFAFEERTGLPEDLALRLPSVSERARALRRDHVFILDKLEELAAAGRVGAGAAEMARYGGRVLRLIEAVSEHEKGETDLIQDAYEDEPGGLD